MLAFINAIPVLRGNSARANNCTHVRSLAHRTIQTSSRRRRVFRCCASMQSDDVTATQDLLYEEMVSDDDYIVIDGKDVAKLVEELQQAGQDQLGDVRDSSSGDEDRLSHDFLTLAEKRSDEWNGRTVVQPVEQETGGGLDEEKGAQTQREELTGSGEDAEKPVGMDYFIDDHVQYMPSWAAEAYQSGEHRDLEHAAMRLNPTSTGQRLHDIVARKKLVGIESLKDVQSGRDGIVDCTVEDVAEDYSVPLEFVVDAMIHYGVPVPISGNQSIRDSMTREEIERLLNLITSFDAVDLSDRYSDRTINELAEVYEISVDAILDVCQKEALYLCSAETTRLSIVREDRVLDIILKGGATGKPYPSLLDGLEK